MKKPAHKIDILEHQQFFEQWDAFSLRDSNLSGEEWSARRTDLISVLANDFLFTNQEGSPADFFIGDDWFQTRVLCIVFFSWHFLCERMLKVCERFVGMHSEWGVSIANDGLDMDHPGPGIVMMISS